MTVEILRRTPVKTNASHASSTTGFVNPTVLEVTQVRVNEGFVRLLLRQIDRRWPASGFGYIAVEDVAVDSGTTVAANARPDTAARAPAVAVAADRPTAVAPERPARGPAPGATHLVIRPETPTPLPSPKAVDSLNFHFLKGGPFPAILRQSLVFRPSVQDSIVVPAGFVVELTSIPRALWSEISLLGEHAMPAIVHDYLYWFQPCEREEADNLLMIAMQQAGVSDLRRGAVYAGVRLASGEVWNANRVARDRGDLRIAPTGVLPTAQESLSEYRARLAKAVIRGTRGRMARQTYCERGKGQ